MKLSKLNKYQSFYNSVYKNGTNSIFNQYMGFDINQVVPLSIAHGVDFEHCYHAMDVYTPAPIHWAYNHRIYERSQKIKPSLLIPHPWAMIASQFTESKGKGTLVIGPPPGKQNDLNLYNLIKNQISSECSILIKRKDGIDASFAFWKSKGLRPIIVPNNDKPFYLNLYLTLSKYENIIGCTFSSALIFAASINKKITLIHGYSYTNYDTIDYLKKVNFNSQYSREVVSTFSNSDQDTITELSKSILGFDLISNKEKQTSNFYKCVDSLSSPVFTPNRDPLYKLKLYLGRRLYWPGLINKSLKDIVRYQNNDVSVNTLNELSIWLDGINSSNAEFKKVKFQPGITIPGNAFEPY